MIKVFECQICKFSIKTNKQITNNELESYRKSSELFGCEKCRKHLSSVSVEQLKEKINEKNNNF